MRTIWAALALAGCASGGREGGAPSDGPGNVAADAPADARAIDAMRPIDARPIDAGIDARPIDAMRALDAAMPDACVPKTTELLLNPAFDLSPAGTNWTQIPIDEIDFGDDITAPPSTLTAQSAPYVDWMGGITGEDEGTDSVTDQVYQDVVVPPGTTQLVLAGYYVVASSEDPNGPVFDTANVDLIETNGTPIEAVLALTNLTTGSTWTAFSHTFAVNESGMTVRVRLTSTNDISNATSFYFDTLSLNATHCP